MDFVIGQTNRRLGIVLTIGLSMIAVHVCLTTILLPANNLQSRVGIVELKNDQTRNHRATFTQPPETAEAASIAVTSAKPSNGHNEPVVVASFDTATGTNNGRVRVDNDDVRFAMRKYLAILEPRTDVEEQSYKHLKAVRIGNGFASYLTMNAMARALNRTLVIIPDCPCAANRNESQFHQLLRTLWRPLSNVADISSIPSQPWWYLTRHGNGQNGECPSVSQLRNRYQLPPWPPSPWLPDPSLCQTNIKPLDKFFNLTSAPDAASLIYIGLEPFYMWTYPSHQPSWLKPFMPGSLSHPRVAPSHVDNECWILPQSHFVAAAKEYKAQQLGSNVLGLHIRLGDMVARPQFMTPAVVLADILNVFAEKHNVTSIYIATVPKPVAYIELLKARTRVPIQLLNKTLACDLVNCSLHKQVVAMMDRLVAAHADIAFYAFAGQSTFADQILRLRFCLNVSTVRLSRHIHELNSYCVPYSYHPLAGKL